MSDFFRVVGVLFAACAALYGLAVGGFFFYAWMAPKYEGVRRDVMIQSRAYNEGTVRELYRLQLQYNGASSDAERALIAAAARHEFSIYPRELLPIDLQAFMQQIN